MAALDLVGDRGADLGHPELALLGRQLGVKDDLKEAKTVADAESRSYSAPALEKGLDILETLCRSDKPLSQKDLAQRLGRSVGEIYRMVTCLVNRNYVTLVDEASYGITTKLFELAHLNPPTHRLLIEAVPIKDQAN